MTVTEITCPRCGESLLTALHVVDGCARGYYAAEAEDRHVDQ